MNIIFVSPSRVRRSVVALFGLIVLCFGAHAENLQVSTTITQGSCHVKVANGENVSGSGAPFYDFVVSDIGTASSSDMLGGGVAGFGAESAVTLSLQCDGVIGAGGGHAPVVGIYGTPVGAGGAAQYLFAGSGGDNTIDARIGAVVSQNKETGGGIHPWNQGNYLKNGDTIPVTVTGRDASDFTTTLYVGMSCGDAVSCDAQGGSLQQGQLDAPITLLFYYN